MGCALMQGVVEDAPPTGSPLPHAPAAAPAPAEPSPHVPPAAPTPAEPAASQTSFPGMVAISLVMLSCFAKPPQLDAVTKCD